MPSVNRTLIPIDTGRKSPYLLEVSRLEAPIRGLPAELHGMTLVHLSDLHAGFGGTDPVHREVVRLVRELAPDLLLLTGDYIDDSVQGDYPIEETLRQFKARLGVFGSLGNHDYRQGVRKIRRKLEQADVQILCNESARIEPGLWVAGVDDWEDGRPDLSRAMQGVPEHVTTLLLSHNPRMIDRAAGHDLLMLSGHTHGAQICLPFPTPSMVCKVHLRCNQVSGWYRNGQARLYVNRGVGVTGRPFRYRCPAEIGVIRLVPAPSDVVERAIPERTRMEVGV